MDDSKPAPPRNPSRTLVIALVAVLIVIAIAGIVLAGLRGRPSGAVSGSASSPTQQDVAATTTIAPPIPAEVGAKPNQLGFEKASDTLSGMTLKKIAEVARSATKESHKVEITAQLEAGAGREQRMELAKKRADAVRKALQANGLSVNAIRVQLSELPPGLVSALDADRLEINMK